MKSNNNLTHRSTGHREPHNQTAFACTAHGAGQHRDSTAKQVISSNEVTIC